MDYYFHLLFNFNKITKKMPKVKLEWHPALRTDSLIKLVMCFSMNGEWAGWVKFKIWMLATYNISLFRMFLFNLFVLFFSNTQHFYTHIHTCALNTPAQDLVHCILFATWLLDQGASDQIPKTIRVRID